MLLRSNDEARKNTFYCFSPPVMIATFIIEISLALYTVWRYKWNAVTRLSVLLLVALSVFQLAEFLVCRGMGGDSLLWSRIGFVAITILPPVGLHLIHVIAKDRRRWMILPGYLAGAAFIAFFSLVGRSIDGHACLGNYVIFQVAPVAGGLYGAYYYALLLASLALGRYHLRRKQPKKTRQALIGLMFGYTIFIIPSTYANLVSPEAISGMPSIMCGFAVLLALALAFIVSPNAAKRKT